MVDHLHAQHARASVLAMVKRKRKPAQNGRVAFNTRLAPDVVALLRAEAERSNESKRGANVVIERLAREHLMGTR